MENYTAPLPNSLPAALRGREQLIRAYMNQENKENRKVLKEYILSVVPDKRVLPVLVGKLSAGRGGNAAKAPGAGIFVAHVFRWDSKGSDPSGWIYQSYPQLQELTGLGEGAQRSARKFLVERGYLEEQKRKGWPVRLFFRVNLTKILEDVCPDLARELEEYASTESETELDLIMRDLPDDCTEKECGICEGGGCAGCCPYEPNRDGYDPAEVPLLTDADALDDLPEPEWLPDNESDLLTLANDVKPTARKGVPVTLANDVKPTISERSLADFSERSLADKQRVTTENVFSENSVSNGEKNPTSPKGSLRFAPGKEIQENVTNQDDLASVSLRQVVSSVSPQTRSVVETEAAREDEARTDQSPGLQQKAQELDPSATDHLGRPLLVVKGLPSETPEGVSYAQWEDYKREYAQWVEEDQQKRDRMLSGMIV